MTLSGEPDSGPSAPQEWRSPAGAARKEHGGGPSGDSRRGRLGQDDDPGLPRAQYGAVLVDEGHDFEPEWLKLVAQMVHPETNSLLVLYDDAQSINRRKARLGFSFAEVGIQARGRTTIRA